MLYSQQENEAVSHTAGHDLPSMKVALEELDMQGISRDDRKAKPADAGWRVRLFKNGVYVASRHFRDATYRNSREASLRAAACYRDEKMAECQVTRRKKGGNEVTQLRKSAGKTQKELAALLLVSPGQVSIWENGRVSRPELRIIKAVLAGEVAPGNSDVQIDFYDTRKALGLGQEHMATLLACSDSTYGRWERGTVRIPGWASVFVSALANGWVAPLGALGSKISARRKAAPADTSDILP